MARSDPQLNFRIPAELKARLEEAARVDGRSLNQELIKRLERSFDFAALDIETEEGQKVIGYADAESLRTLMKLQEKALKSQEQTIAELREQLSASKASTTDIPQRLDRLMLQVDALHKWMQRQPEDRHVYLMDDASSEEVVVGKVRAPAAPKKKGSR